jgi:GDSL-like Lipase/Acylhydrolase family
MRRRRLVSIASGLLMVTGVATTTSPLGAATPNQSRSLGAYYVALGDSVPISDGPGSYPNLILAHHPGRQLQLENMAVSGETTTSMISGPQYWEATTFLNLHKGQIALITIDIGGNDLLPCIEATDVQTCVANTLVTVKSNLRSMLAGLRAAAGPQVPIIGMNYFNPLLGDWLAPPGPAQTLLADSVSAVLLLNGDLAQVYGEAGSPVADVFDAFHTSDLSQMVHSHWGLVPLAVKKACTLLDITCSKGQSEGFGDDPVAAGAVIIAHAFDKVIRLHPG